MAAVFCEEWGHFNKIPDMEQRNDLQAGEHISNKLEPELVSISHQKHVRISAGENESRKSSKASTGKFFLIACLRVSHYVYLKAGRVTYMNTYT